MKEKSLWITAVILSSVTWGIHFRYFSSNDFSTSEKRIWWFIDIWATHAVIGLSIFPLTLILALLIPKRLTYATRFNKVLPIIIIIVEIILIYSLGSLVYGMKHGYLKTK